MKFKIDIQRVEKSKLPGVDFDNLPFGRIFTDHMLIADYYDGEWHNPRIEPFGRMSICPSISAIHYGQAIFEGMKAHKDLSGVPVIFRPEKNFQRFNKSAYRMAMPEIPEELFIGGMAELINLDKDWIPTTEGSSLYIRPFMFATDEYVGIKPADTFRFMMFCCPVGPYYQGAVKVKVSDTYVRAFAGGVGSAKAAGNYAATMLPLKEARDEGYDQLLWMDGVEFKYIHEIGTMNIFFQIEDTVYTPSLEEGTILDGVTRDTVIQLMRDRGIQVKELKLSIDNILDAYEKGVLIDAFGTGTAATIAPISHIGYKDRVLELSNNSQSRVSLWLKEELEQIKTGKIEDKHNWLYKVEESVIAEK